LEGASPDRKDIYVELDVLQSASDLTALQGAVDRIEQAFLEVPGEKVGNPDGRPGIALHLEIDEADRQDGVGLATASGAFTGDRWWASWTETDCPPFWPPEWLPTAQEFFGTPGQRAESNPALLEEKKQIYRHAFYGGSHPCGVGGMGTGAVFFVALGGWPNLPNDLTGRTEWIAGAIMHELGHTLTLRHGGRTDELNSPNYHSIMNYTWAVPWLKYRPSSSMAQQRFSDSWQLDYSRRAFPILAEYSLQEALGILGHPNHSTMVGPPVASGPSQGEAVYETEFFPVDWNRNGTIDPDRVGPIDINWVGESHEQTVGTVHQGQDDWSSLSTSLCGFYLSDDWTNSLTDPNLLELPDESYGLNEGFGEIAASSVWTDCNRNGVLDDTDLAAGLDTDLDGNGLLDGCEPLWGDLDQDGDIDDDDRDLLTASFGRTEGESFYRPLADLDFDRTVTHLDYQLWVEAYDDYRASLQAPTSGGAASSTGTRCGLLGPEAVLLVWLVRRRRRRR
jgi:hypothetical protein